MSTPLTVTTDKQDDGTTVVRATGEIDLSNIDTFTQALASATADGSVTVDLRGVEYLDSVAINALFTYADHIHVISGQTLMSVLTISGLTDLVSVEQRDAPTRQ